MFCKLRSCTEDAIGDSEYCSKHQPSKDTRIMCSVCNKKKVPSRTVKTCCKKCWSELKAVVVSRDNYTCKRCGYFIYEALVCHHILPQSKEGKNEISNLITLCRNCHTLVHAGIIKSPLIV